MIDLHTHILPGIDDGAANAEVSAAQLQSLKEQGVDKVVFTSHYYGRKRSPEQFLEARAEAFDKIRAAVPQGTEVYLGAEVHFTAQMAVSDEALCSMTIENTRYLLIELPFLTDWDSGLMRRIADFISETDRVPVVAHVERYSEVQKRPALLSELSGLGCLLQMNASAFLEKDHSLAFSALRHGYVDCFGTDTHNMTDRAPRYAEAKAAIEKEGLSEEFARMQENMRLILRDESVSVHRGKPVKKFLGRYY